MENPAIGGVKRMMALIKESVAPKTFSQWQLSLTLVEDFET